MIKRSSVVVGREETSCWMTLLGRRHPLFASSMPCGEAANHDFNWAGKNDWSASNYESPAPSPVFINSWFIVRKNGRNDEVCGGRSQLGGMWFLYQFAEVTMLIFPCMEFRLTNPPIVISPPLFNIHVHGHITSKRISTTLDTSWLSCDVQASAVPVKLSCTTVESSPSCWNVEESLA